MLRGTPIDVALAEVGTAAVFATDHDAIARPGSFVRGVRVCVLRAAFVFVTLSPGVAAAPNAASALILARIHVGDDFIGGCGAGDREQKAQGEGQQGHGQKGAEIRCDVHDETCS